MRGIQRINEHLISTRTSPIEDAGDKNQMSILSQRGQAPLRMPEKPEKPEEPDKPEKLASTS